ncbi:efflux RND transporter periplasmic adaptor subunit, partial [Parvularcula flava]
VISSRELADLKAEYLASVSAEDLARTDLAREEKLYADQITAEADLLNARAASRKASAARESSETKLHALGIGHDVIDRLASAPDGSLSQFTLGAPIPGQIIRRDLTHGQSVDAASAEPLIVIVDTSTVWADITVYKEDLSRLVVGNEAILRSDDGAMLATGGISFISPVVEETSRTATARLVLDNPDGTLRPGQFVTAHIAAGETIEALLVPENAIQLVEGRTSVFVPAEDGFRPQPVQTGRKVGQKIEILSGLDLNDSYVSTGAFTLKAELEKDAFGDGHNH